MAKPFLSVLIDTYNHQRFIEQAVRSALEQDFSASEREVLVVDDGSTDGTREILRKFEPGVRVIRKENGGQASAFNVGIPECRGEIIAFLDGDDWWEPGKLRAVSEVFASDAAIGIVGHAIVEVLSDGTRRIVAPEKNERLRLDSLAAARVFRLRKSYLGTSRMALRAELAKRILPVPEDLVIEADEYLFTVAAALSEMVILKDALTNYHIHGGNLYVSAGESPAGQRRKQEVMEGLANSLRSALPTAGAREDVTNCVVEIVQAEADQLRLMLDGGAPWETVRTEKKIYEVLHGDAPLKHRVFRQLTMVAAGVLPPKWFYQARRWVGSRRWYEAGRRKVMPVPKIASDLNAEAGKN